MKRLAYVHLKTRDGKGFTERAFAFRCENEEIQVGDIVKVPTVTGFTLGRVSLIEDADEADIAKHVITSEPIREIWSKAEPEEPPAEQLTIDGIAPMEPVSDIAEPTAPDEIILVKQLPVIEERLLSVQEEVERITREAAAMVCTEDTIQAVKSRRAELNKKFTELEDRRKFVKAAVMEPYNSFEAVYKDCITGPFSRADAELKAKVGAVEAEMKRRCEDRLRTYFAELCTLHNVDFITYEQAGVKVDMASAKARTPKKLMDRISEFVAGVAVGCDQIRQMDDAAEIMAEYKKCLNVGKAVAIVQDRHRQIESERKAAEEREARRKLQEEAVAKVESVAPPVDADPPKHAEKIFPRFTFAVVNVTKSQLIKVREFMKQEGIQYE